MLTELIRGLERLRSTARAEAALARERLAVFDDLIARIDRLAAGTTSVAGDTATAATAYREALRTRARGRGH